VRVIPVLLATIAAGACVTAVAPKLPDDVAASIASEPMRRMETDGFILYYPAARRAQALRFAARAEGCGGALVARARVHNVLAREKPILVLPDAPFNNAYVSPPMGGEEDYAVVPLYDTFDFTTELGVPPDPGYIGCHELTHYTHGKQITGFWYALDLVLGNAATPQAGLDSWFWEGLATHYEAQLQPNAGRPRWPIFTGMFAAAYAGRRVGGGDLSEWNREPPPGGNYLVGTMFIDFLARRYGEGALWRVIEEQAGSWTIVLGINSTFSKVYGKSLSELIDEFADETARLPVRATPAGERRVRGGGDDARYARGVDGTEAIIANDVDVPAHLDVYAPDGSQRASIALVSVVPPRTLVMADPILTSGLSITRAGDVYFTAIDQGATYQVTRLLRARDGSLDEVATDLGPGACVSPDGRTYYTLPVDGDRWSLAAYDLATGARRTLVDSPPGQYVLAAQPSPDGSKLIASVWSGRFAIWIVDTATGAIASKIEDAGPLYDGAFVDDTHVVYLSEIDGRFQAVIRDLATGAVSIATDAPYAVLNARAANGTLRFLSRTGWEWNVDEVDLSTAHPERPRSVRPERSASEASAESKDPHILSDDPYHHWDHLFIPTLHTLAFYLPVSNVALLGAQLAGSDRLGFHRWAIAGYLQPDTREPSIEAAYLDATFAPFLLEATFSDLTWTETDKDVFDNDVRVHRHERDATFAFGRVWRGSWSAYLLGLASQIDDLRAIGPGLSLGYSGFEATPYAGARRGFALALDGAHYETIDDLRAQLDVALPVIGLRRPTLHATATARDLITSTSGFLELGGIASLAPLYQASTDPSLPEYTGPDLPPLVGFAEPLRGYEDFPITTDRAAIVEAHVRVPWIHDLGSATSLYFLPAFFQRELDLELFASGAIDETMNVRTQHAAAGVSITISAIVFHVPVLLTYQIARRLRDDDAWTQLVGFGPGL